MSFLKISGLVIGTGSVVGGAGAGIYYGVIKKTQFVGKIVFEKKTATNGTVSYLIKLLTLEQYTDKEKKFNEDKNEVTEKYAAVNKVIEISHELKFSELETKLKEIFGAESSLTDAKNKVSTNKAIELKKLLGEEIYKNLKTALGA